MERSRPPVEDPGRFEFNIPPPLLEYVSREVGAELLRVALAAMSDTSARGGVEIPQTKRQEKAMWDRIKVLYGRREASTMKKNVKTNWAGVRRVETIETRLDL